MGSHRAKVGHIPTPSLLVTQVTSTGISLSWSLPRAYAGVSQYILERGTDNVTFGTTVYTGTNLSYTNTFNPSSGVRYYYRVRYLTTEGKYSAYSTSVSGIRYAPIWAGSNPIALGTVQGGVGGTFNLAQYASDPDGDNLVYALVAPPAGFSINQSTGLLSISGSTVANSYTIIATISDGGDTVSRTFSATVQAVVAGSLVHGQTFNVGPGTFGTRPDYNTGNFTWNGHRHIHWRWTTFENGFPADGSAKLTYQQYCGGWWPMRTYNLPASPAAESMTIEVGGPSMSGRYFRSKAQAGDWAAQRSIGSRIGDNGETITSRRAYWRFKQRNYNTGKWVRWWFNTPSLDHDIWMSRDYFQHEGVANANNGYLYPGDYPGDIFPTGVWATYELLLRTDTLTSSPSSIIRRNGTEVRTKVNEQPASRFRTILDFDTFNTDPINHANAMDALASSTGPALPEAQWSEQHYTDIYFDFTEARVEIVNGSVVEVQPVSSWGASQITIIHNKGELPSGAATLRVLDANSNVIHTQAVNVQ